MNEYNLFLLNLKTFVQPQKHFKFCLYIPFNSAFCPRGARSTLTYHFVICILCIVRFGRADRLP